MGFNYILIVCGLEEDMIVEKFLEGQTLEAINPLKGVLQAKLVSPRKIILFWEVSNLPQKIIQLFFAKSFKDLVQLIRIYDVTDIIFNGRNAHHYYEIAYSYENGYWSIKGLSPNRSYIAEIGVKFSRNDFFPILRSNNIQIPMSDVPNGEEMLFNLTKQQSNSHPPKWIDHVSTYSFYEDSQTTEKNNG